jgi:hypothetical protein
MEEQKFISVGSTEFLNIIQMNFILERLMGQRLCQGI